MKSLLLISLLCQVGISFGAQKCLKRKYEEIATTKPETSHKKSDSQNVLIPVKYFRYEKKVSPTEIVEIKKLETFELVTKKRLAREIFDLYPWCFDESLLKSESLPIRFKQRVATIINKNIKNFILSNQRDPTMNKDFGIENVAQENYLYPYNKIEKILYIYDRIPR